MHFVNRSTRNNVVGDRGYTKTIKLINTHLPKFSGKSQKPLTFQPVIQSPSHSLQPRHIPNASRHWLPI